MYTQGIKHARRLALALSVAGIGLTACGGGGEDGLGGPEYVSWQNNANDTVILDWNNDRYAVRISDRAVVSMMDKKALTGLSVNTSAELWDSGVRVGSVVAGVSTSGSTIAVFKCTNGRNLNITETSTTFSYACV